jgi:hypothetical protein
MGTNMDIERLKIKFMEMMQAHKGRERAVPRERIFLELKIFAPDLTDRKFRDMYSNLPICSCDVGLFLPKSPQEVQEFKEYLRKKAIPMLERYKRILAYYPDLAPESEERQLEIF